MARISVLTALLALLCSGCSINRYAANRAADALSGTGTVFASDDDPDLVKDAAPFSLKLMESVLESTPDHRELLLSTSSGFTQFAYAFVEQEADAKAVEDFDGSRPMYARARRLYLRARDYGLRGLAGNVTTGESAAASPNRMAAAEALRAKLRQDPKNALGGTTKKDVPLLYWTAAAWGKAIGLSKDDPELLADLPAVEALIDRALALDESYDRGAIHSMLISYEMIRPRGEGEAADRARTHFERALALSERQNAGPYVSLAEAVALPAQDRKGFESLLKQALEINPDAHPEQRLMNLVMQRRAQWLLSRMDELFIEPE